MPLEEEIEMRSGLDAGESGPWLMIKLSFRVLGLSSFLTVGEDETRAWTITNGTLAPKAAGVIHSDIERGFIRAETERTRISSIVERWRRHATEGYSDKRGAITWCKMAIS